MPFVKTDISSKYVRSTTHSETISYESDDGGYRTAEYTGRGFWAPYAAVKRLKPGFTAADVDTAFEEGAKDVLAWLAGVEAALQGHVAAEAELMAGRIPAPVARLGRMPYDPVVDGQPTLDDVWHTEKAWVAHPQFGVAEAVQRVRALATQSDHVSTVVRWLTSEPDLAVTRWGEDAEPMCDEEFHSWPELPFGTPEPLVAAFNALWPQARARRIATWKAWFATQDAAALRAEELEARRQLAIRQEAWKAKRDAMEANWARVQAARKALGAGSDAAEGEVLVCLNPDDRRGRGFIGIAEDGKIVFVRDLPEGICKRGEYVAVKDVRPQGPRSSSAQFVGFRNAPKRRRRVARRR